MTSDDLCGLIRTIELLRNADEWLDALRSGPAEIEISLPGKVYDSKLIEAEDASAVQTVLISYFTKYRADLVAELTAAGIPLDPAPSAPAATAAEGV